MTDKDIIDEMVNELGRYTDLWGLGTTPGRVVGTLYFWGPKTQEQLREELGLSLGAVSHAIKMAETFGIVSVCGKEGRKNIYMAELSQKKKIKAVFEIAIHRHINPMLALIDENLPKIRDKELKTKVTKLKSKYAKATTFMKFILGFSGK